VNGTDVFILIEVVLCAIGLIWFTSVSDSYEWTTKKTVLLITLAWEIMLPLLVYDVIRDVKKQTGGGTE
jgi:hypothetical protein